MLLFKKAILIQLWCWRLWNKSPENFMYVGYEGEIWRLDTKSKVLFRCVLSLSTWLCNKMLVSFNDMNTYYTLSHCLIRKQGTSFPLHYQGASVFAKAEVMLFLVPHLSFHGQMFSCGKWKNMSSICVKEPSHVSPRSLIVFLISFPFNGQKVFPCQFCEPTRQ